MYRKKDLGDAREGQNEVGPISENPLSDKKSLNNNELKDSAAINTALIDIEVRTVLVGGLSPLGRHQVPSGIYKSPVMGPIRITHAGLVGDRQGDTRHHGGPEKAIHHYAFDHYASWRLDFPASGWFAESGLSSQAGGFGENISTLGITEADVCIGDIFRLGTALVQVSQARQPCWRLNERFGHAAMARHVQNNGRTGWYYRVLEEGQVKAGDHLLLVERPVPEWSLKRTLDVLYRDVLNMEALTFLAALPVLAQSWRQLAERRLTTQSVESWSRRLITPESL